MTNIIMTISNFGNGIWRWRNGQDRVQVRHNRRNDSVDIITTDGTVTLNAMVVNMIRQNMDWTFTDG